MKQNKMKIIGITGGVGAGKSQILSYIESNYHCRIIRADEAAHMLQEPGQACYERLIKLLGRDVLNEDGTINKGKMAAIIFTDKAILIKVNQIIHPEVKTYIREQIAYEQERGEVDYFFIEAALLIEEHYDEIVDALWYVHADVEVRSRRLRESRSYSDQKIADIMKEQLGEAQFREKCQVVITNNGDLEETYRQINKVMGETK